MVTSPRFQPKNVFVTVGSTSFEELIQSVIDPGTIDQLRRLGFRKLTIQTGEYLIDSGSVKDIELFSYKYTNNLSKDISEADLVIGHAGAGTCLEVLRQKKRLLVVTNDSLMDRHQDELANQLSEDRYLIKTKLDDLHENLEKICAKDIQLREFPSANESKFEAIFNKALSGAKVS